MRTLKWLFACVALTASGSGFAASVVVGANAEQPTPLTTVVAGKTYRITVSGTVDLYTACNAGRGLPFYPDGRPGYAFPAPYTEFVPNGSDIVMGSHGIGGLGRLYGVLFGSFSANPQGPPDWFAIGNYHVFTAQANGTLYGRVNDCCFNDNGGAYTVVVEEVVLVQAIEGGLTQIGHVTAGKNYRLTVNGVVDLNLCHDGGRGLSFFPNGRPTHQFGGYLGGFWPNGSDVVPASGPNAYGVGGPGKLYGMLLGSFTASPSGYADYFAIGATHVFTAQSTGPIYGRMNDCCFSDNAGAYSVALTEVSGHEAYAYDALGRLVSVGRIDGSATAYQYDAAGNRTSVTTTGSQHN